MQVRRLHGAVRRRAHSSMRKANLRCSHRQDDSAKQQQQQQQQQQPQLPTKEDQVPLLRGDSQLSRERRQRVSSRQESSSATRKHVRQRALCGQEKVQRGDAAHRQVGPDQQHRGLCVRLL